MLLNTLLTPNVPEILHSRYRWKSWLDVMNLRMNISGTRHHMHLIQDEFDNHEPETAFVKFTIAW